MVSIIKNETSLSKCCNNTSIKCSVRYVISSENLSNTYVLNYGMVCRITL